MNKEGFNVKSPVVKGVEIYMVLGEVRRCTSRIAIVPFVFYRSGRSGSLFWS